VIITNVERVRGLETFGDYATFAWNIIRVSLIVIEEDKLFAVCKLIQNATLRGVYTCGEAAR
jgi:hypothetical protein